MLLLSQHEQLHISTFAIHVPEMLCMHWLQWFTKAGFQDVKIKRIGPSWYRGVRRHGLIMGCSVTGTKPKVSMGCSVTGKTPKVSVRVRVRLRQ